MFHSHLYFMLTIYGYPIFIYFYYLFFIIDLNDLLWYKKIYLQDESFWRYLYLYFLNTKIIIYIRLNRYVIVNLSIQQKL